MLEGKKALNRCCWSALLFLHKQKAGFLMTRLNSLRSLALESPLNYRI